MASHAAAPPSWNWGIRRWDGSRFHREVPRLPDGFAGRSAVWESADGRLLGAVHPEGDGGHEAFLELDPDARQLQPAMLAWAEAAVAATLDGVRTLDVVTWDYDLPRRRLLAERGYAMLDEGSGCAGSGSGRRRCRRPPSPRATGCARPRPSRTTRSAWPPSSTRRSTARSTRPPSTRRSWPRSPSFRHDLNLVAETEDGSFAAHVGVTLDEVNRHGVFEPVCTHPAHVRRGLARALLFEGMRRLQALGAVTVDVETGDAEAANAFYASCGFTEEYRAHTWRRTWPADG